MNIMRKLLASQSTVASEDPQQTAQHAALGLMHLKKLFSEYSHPSFQPQPLSLKEQEDKLYNMLPLFCKVFGNSPAKDMLEKFTDIYPFCQQVCKVMVSEIRRRASNQSIEAASCSIAKFLEIESTEESSNGWMLLTTINLLVVGDPSLIEVMTASSLPSTLVKCLYLFFDLPDVDNSAENTASAFTPLERRILLQKVFCQILTRLCTHLAPAEELARKDDLALLFSAITSWCPVHNLPWRKSAAEVLATLSRHCLSQNVVSYIHNKGCVALCLENMQRIPELSPLEIVEMLVTVFCFLKDSTEVAQTLLDDFRSCQGYVFLSEFLLRLEQSTEEESQEALRNLVLLVASLAMCGYIELKPSLASTGSLFQMQGFHIAQPSGRGTSVRNVQAFQVLQSAFLKSNSTNLCSYILDAISGVYHADTANYFILEPQHTLSQFAEKIHLKPKEVQEKFFQILEFIVHQLCFVPCKELISLSILLKTQSSVECSIICMKTLLNILKHDNIFKDVYREVGLLEVMVTCLHRYAALLKETHEIKDDELKEVAKVEDDLQSLGFFVMDALAILLNNNNSNASVFRECGGARCAHNMVPYLVCRQQALTIVQQLILCNGGDDDMGTLLGMMHSAPLLALEYKTDILTSLLQVLRESHRTRTVFRKVGGFVYVMSCLVSMEGCLMHPPKTPWDTVDISLVLTLLKTAFNTITVAMRFEPANAKFFAQEICYSSLTDAIRLLGCFSNELVLNKIEPFPLQEEESIHSIFTSKNDICLQTETFPKVLSFACWIFRLLYDMSLDARSGSSGTIQSLPLMSPSHSRRRNVSGDLKGNTSVLLCKRQQFAQLNLTPPDIVIVHPVVVVAMLHLIPSISYPEQPAMANTLHLYITEVLKSMMRSERNQQVMCDAGFPHELLSRFSVALVDEENPLHSPLQYMFERIAAQGLEPKDLRDFMRLGNPLCSRPLESLKKDSDADQREGGPVPLTRVKTLVSMTTPKDFQINSASLIPPFVEFDMSHEGFGCLYLPSVAPQSASGPTVVNVGMGSAGDNTVIGGIGSGDRLFPPQTGLTYSTWICIEKFSDSAVDSHSINLLSLTRHTTAKDEQLYCLTIIISPLDKTLVISTQEISTLVAASADWVPEVLGDSGIRLETSELFQEGQWHHIMVVLNRAVLKNSSISLYVDGLHIKTRRMHYISQNPGGGAANLTIASSVYGCIGTPPSCRKFSKLTWRQGPCLLVEDMFTHQMCQTLYRLGPNYLGSLQAPICHGVEVASPLVPEEKVVFGLNAVAMSGLTLAKIRKVYSKVDSKAIAKQLGMSSHENATPVYILHNSAGHLSGPARSLGGVLIGYLGARTFCSRPVARMIENVAGCNSLLGLIAMATDVEGLYAAVKALVCIVQSNRAATMEMDRIRGYQTLAMLLKKKRHFLNSHILQLTFSLVGTVDSGRENMSIPNPLAFSDLLCDLEIWRDVTADLQRSLYEHFYELITESRLVPGTEKSSTEIEQRTNLKLMRQLGLVPKLLFILKDGSLSDPAFHVVIRLLGALLHTTNVTGDLLRFGQFVASTLSPSSINEKQLVEDDFSKLSLSAEDSSNNNLIQTIQMRNRALDLLYNLCAGGLKPYIPFCEDIIKVLGFDWILLFLQGHLHSSTVLIAFRILIVMLKNHKLLSKFRDGSSNGGWLQDTESMQENRKNVVLGFNVNSVRSMNSREEKDDVNCVPGFQMLQWLMPNHVQIQELYFYILGLLVGQTFKQLPQKLQFNLDSIRAVLFSSSSQKGNVSQGSRVEICPDVMLVVLSMIRSMINNNNNRSPDAVDDAWLTDYPITLIQFLLYLYHNTPEFVPVCMTSEVLAAFTSTLFPESSVTSDTQNTADNINEGQSVHLDDKEAELIYPQLFTNHPAKKVITDFLKVIIVDSLSFPVTNKTQPVIDLLLDAVPEKSSFSQQRVFQTEFLTSLMEHLLATDILLGEQANLPILSGGSYSYIASNVYYVASRLVDKLWQGVYIREPSEVYDLLLKLIHQAKRRTSPIHIEPFYRCLNRTILYQLSRPVTTISEHITKLESLQKLKRNSSIILGPENVEQEFFACFCYCLLQTTEEMSIPTDVNWKTKWHVKSSSATNSPKESGEGNQKLELLIIAAKRLWEELYVCKKSTLEDVFKTNFTLGNQQRSPVELHAVRDLIYEPAYKIWQNFLESEKKCNKTSLENQSQFQQMVNFSGFQKLQKVTGGLTRLATRKPRRVESIKFKLANVTWSDVCSWTAHQVSVVQELVDFQCKQSQQNHQHMQKYVSEEWFQTEFELTRELSIWGPPVGSSLDKWLLDMTEGPSRMRKKMIRNRLFYLNYPYRPDVENGNNKALKFKVAMSYDSKKHYQYQRSAKMVEREAAPVEATEVVAEETNNDVDISDVMREIGFQGIQSSSVSRPAFNRNTSDLDEDQDCSDPNSNESSNSSDEKHKPDNQTLVRLLEEGEKITHMFRCARIQGLDTSEGLLLFGQDHFYIIDGFTLLKTREIKEIDYLPHAMYEPIIPSSTSYRSNRDVKNLCSKLAYEDIREVHKRRYLLQPIALEVFSADGRNYLLAFTRGMRNKVYQRFMALATSISDNAQQSVAGQKRTANVEQSGSLLSSLIGETSVTQRWVREEISNFQYLMHLNTLAGRSYNDLMQYPVFPWILADYESEELDLNDPVTFRDLSKPLGAQSPDRLAQFKRRYKEWDDPHGETPPYHYGTHYSSAMIVASYLVRMEPFTQHFLRLQGGHFDLADRMFHSIRDAWLSASKHNMADVKELIPEFFYLPEFLINSNHFDLGSKQNGIELNDVILPSWAKGDPREFIRVHRQALECDYVSSHLHEWIDLIFGYKQHGQAAIDATNVFHHLFYEGNVDIYNIDDPLKKNATIGFINNFGQIPKQLFKKPHPAKRFNHRISIIESVPLAPSLSIKSDKLFFHNLDNLQPSLAPIKELKGPIGQIIHNEKTVLAVEQNKTIIPPLYTKYLAWGFADHSLRIGNYESDKASFVHEMSQYGEVLCAACPNSKLIITAGTSTVVNVWEFSKKQLVLKQNLYGHTEPVTCIAASPSYNIIVSGSRDRTCILWDMSRLIFVRQLTIHAAPVAAVAINEITGDLATCAGTYLYLWTINGQEVASINTSTGRNDRFQQILCVAFSQIYEWDSLNVIMTGSSDGVVRMWSAEYVQIPLEDSRKKNKVKQAIELREEAQVDSASTEVQSPEKSSQMSTSEKLQNYVRRLSCVGKQEGQESEDIIGWNLDSVPLHDRTGSIGGSESSLSEEDGCLATGMSQSYLKERKFSDLNVTADEIDCTLLTVTGTGSPDDATSPISIITIPDNSKTSSLSWNPGDVEIVCEDLPKTGCEIPTTKNGGYNRNSAIITSDSNSLTVDQGSIRISKSDTSLTDSYVLVTEGDINELNKSMAAQKQIKSPNSLREGFKWQCQLVFRSKLTMHTAYDRKDNSDPAAVTALAISKDHKTVYVGDAKGRLFSWSVPDHPGRAVADHWVKDEGVDSCTACNVKFSFSERRHHCRNCGQLFCSRCSRFESEIKRLHITRPVRVCSACYTRLRFGNQSTKSQSGSKNGTSMDVT
ncbi:hypothetical protein CHUAL_001189 [Chamberlinius hualienensis]